MFFVKRKDKESEFLKLRQRQILELEKIIPEARPLDKDKNAYEVSVNTKYGPLTLRIILDPSFPERPPRLKLNQRVLHQWVDNEMNIVNVDKLGRDWSPHNILGKIVEELLGEFYRNPPSPCPPVQAVSPSPSPFPSLNPPPSPSPAPAISHSSSISSSTTPNSFPASQGMERVLQPQVKNGMNQSSPSTPSSSSSSSSLSYSSISADGKTPLPKIPESFDRLDAFSIGELEELLIDETEIYDMVQNMDSVKEMTGLRDSLFQDIDQLARGNLAYRDEIVQLQAALKDLHEKTSQKINEYRLLIERVQKVNLRYSLRSTQQQLEASIESLEEKAHQMKKRYEQDETLEKEDKENASGNSLSHADFCTNYIKLRKEVHLRSAKNERISDMHGANFSFLNLPHSNLTLRTNAM